MSDSVKDLLKTFAWIIAVVIVCAFGYMFLIRGAMELAQEYKSFSNASVSNSTQFSQNSGRIFPVATTTNPNWIEYVSPTNDFSIQFPQTPEVLTFTQDHSILHIYKAGNENETFQVDRITSFEARAEATPDELQMVIEDIAASQNKKIESVYVDTRAEVVRFALIDEDFGEALKGVLVPINGTTLYVLQYSCYERSCNEDRFISFVSSFTTER